MTSHSELITRIFFSNPNLGGLFRGSFCGGGGGGEGGGLRGTRTG